jgi:hypothetical protein
MIISLNYDWWGGVVANRVVIDLGELVKVALKGEAGTRGPRLCTVGTVD